LFAEKQLDLKLKATVIGVVVVAGTEKKREREEL